MMSSFLGGGPDPLPPLRHRKSFFPPPPLPLFIIKRHVKSTPNGPKWILDMNHVFGCNPLPPLCHHLSSFGKLPPSPLSDDIIFE